MGRRETIGPYRILSELGRGGMGVVYKAFHPGLKRTVALKVLIAGEDASVEAIARFHREAEAVARLGHHPNIVPVYDIGQVERGGATHASPLHYFAMHLVEGMSLDRMIDDGAIAPKTACRIARKIAEALQHAHDHGILHRDVKPANILMALPEREMGREGEGAARGQGDQATRRPREEAEDGARSPSLPLAHSPSRADFAGAEPMLTDFGLAKDGGAESKMTRSGMALGTPNYMSPEQAGGRTGAVDARSDVYSLGATLYEMLSSAPPFEGASAAEVIQKVLTKDPAPLRRRNPLVDRDVETICLRCLEKDPAGRYPSARDLSDDLGRFLDGEPIVARPVSLLEKAFRRARRNKALTAALAALAAVAVAAAAVAVTGARRVSEERTRAGSERSEKEAVREEGRKREAWHEKSRRISKVLLSASSRLGKIHAALQKGRGDPSVDDEARRAAFEAARTDIDAWEASFGDDPPSQAAAIAVKAWLLAIGGLRTEAEEQFARSRKTDPEVAVAALFQGMIVMGALLERQRLPMARIGPSGLEFGAVPKDPEAAGGRKRFDALHEEMAGSSAWDPEVARNLGKALEGLAFLQAGRFGEAEESLTRALEQPELLWFEGDVRLARAKTRYMRGVFDDGFKDVEAVLEARPRFPGALYLRDALRVGKGLLREISGDDAAPLFREAVDGLSETLRLLPGHPSLLLARGAAGVSLARALQRRGEPCKETLSLALEDFTRAGELLPDDGGVRADVGAACIALGDDAAIARENAEPWFRRALESYDGALSANPGLFVALEGRALAALRLGGLGEPQTEEALRLFEAALRDADAALLQAPAANLHFVRACVLMRLARARGLRGGGGRPCLEQALTACDESLAGNPGDGEVHKARGIILEQLGRFEEAVPALEKASGIPGSGAREAAQALSRARAAAQSPSWSREATAAAWALLRGDFDEAEKRFSSAAADAPPGDPRGRSTIMHSRYNLACIRAQRSAGRTAPFSVVAPPAPEAADAMARTAIEDLRAAFEAGWTNLEHARNDPDLEAVRGLQEFRDLLAERESGKK